MNKAENHEVVSIYSLDDDLREAILLEQKECVFNWCTQDEWPMGVIHSYIWRRGSIWITAAAHRHRVSALRRNPKTSVVITSKGTSFDAGKSITVKGRAKIHEDRDLKMWFYPELAGALRSTPDEVKAFEEMLDSPLRIVIEVVPEKWITYDGAKMRAHTLGTIDETQLAKPLEADTVRLEAEKKRRGINHD